MASHNVDFYLNLGCDTHLAQQEPYPQLCAYDGTPTDVNNIWTRGSDYARTSHDANASPHLLTNFVTEQGKFIPNLQHWPPTQVIPDQSMTQAIYDTSPITNYTSQTMSLQQRSFEDVSCVQGPFVPGETSLANSSDARVITGIRGSTPFTAMTCFGDQAIAWYPIDIYHPQVGMHGEASVHENSGVWIYVDRVGVQNVQSLLYTDAVTGPEISVFRQASSSDVQTTSTMSACSCSRPIAQMMRDSSNHGTMLMPPMSFGDNSLVEKSVNGVNSPPFSTKVLDGVRWHVCSCGYRTYQRGRMKRHCDSLRHSKERKYRCSKCLKKFTRDDARKRHERHCKKQRLLT